MSVDEGNPLLVEVEAPPAGLAGLTARCSACCGRARDNVNSFVARLTVLKSTPAVKRVVLVVTTLFMLVDQYLDGGGRMAFLVAPPDGWILEPGAHSPLSSVWRHEFDVYLLDPRLQAWTAQGHISVLNGVVSRALGASAQRLAVGQRDGGGILELGY